MTHRFDINDILIHRITDKLCKIVDLLPLGPFLLEPVYTIEYLHNKETEIVTESELIYNKIRIDSLQNELNQGREEKPKFLANNEQNPYNMCICGAWATSEPDFHAFYCNKWRKK